MRIRCALSAGLVLVGCRSLPAEIASCPDLDCGERWVTAYWAEDSASVLAQVAALPPGRDRDALIQVMTERWPGGTAPLCELLPLGAAQSRCRDLNERPHLWQVDEADPAAGETGSGKVYRNIAVELDDPQLPWAGDAPVQAPCDDPAHRNTCQVHAAQEAARAGRSRDASLLCQGAEGQKWVYECHFTVAEEAYVPERAGQPGPAAELCLGSGYFLYRCLGHLAGEVSRAAPAAHSQDAAAWQGLEAAAQEVHRVLARTSSELAQRWVDQLWADSMAWAYEGSGAPDGAPLDHVGDWALPHVRAAVAWQLWTSGTQRRRQLDWWAQQVEQALQRRLEGQPEVHGDPLLDGVGGHWIDDLAGEEELAWLAYRGFARRAVHSDPGLDAAICVVEAAARNPGLAQAALLREALRHPDPLLRWTAARLAADMAPAALADMEPRSEANALVRGRLEWARTRDRGRPAH